MQRIDGPEDILARIGWRRKMAECPWQK